MSELALRSLRLHRPPSQEVSAGWLLGGDAPQASWIMHMRCGDAQQAPQITPVYAVAAQTELHTSCVQAFHGLHAPHPACLHS